MTLRMPVSLGVAAGACLALLSACGSSGHGSGGSVSGSTTAGMTSANGGGSSVILGTGTSGSGNSSGVIIGNADAGTSTGADSGAPSNGAQNCAGATLGIKGTWGQGDVFGSWLSSRSNSGATALADQTLTAALLAPYQVIISQDVSHNHVYSAAEVQVLSDWVNKGGGFMTLAGYSPADDEINNVNRLLMPFSMSYQNIHILPKGNSASTVAVTMWNPHPIDMGVTAVGVDNGYPVAGMGDVIATGGGYTLGIAQTVGTGHVFAWTDEWITYNSEWDSHPDYQVQTFWVNAVKWLTVAAQCEVTIPTSNPPM